MPDVVMRALGPGFFLRWVPRLRTAEEDEMIIDCSLAALVAAGLLIYRTFALKLLRFGRDAVSLPRRTIH
jgi:hypothetical protein